MLTCLLVLHLVEMVSFFLATVITQKSSKIVTLSLEKHDAMKLLAQSKLGSIVNIFSQAKQCKNILPGEFSKVLQEVEKYHKRLMILETKLKRR